MLWALAVVVLITFAFTGFGFGNVWDHTENRLVAIPGTESYKANQLLAKNETTNYAIYLIVDGVDMDKQHREVLNVLQATTKNLQEIPGVIPAGVLHPFAAGDKTTNPKAAELMKEFIAKNKQGFLMITLLDLTQFPERAKEIRQMAESEMQQVAKDMRSFAPKAHGMVSDKDLKNETIAGAAEIDTRIATIAAICLIALIIFVSSGSLHIALLILLASISGWSIAKAFTNLVSTFVPPCPDDPALVTIISLITSSSYAILLLARTRANLALIKYTAEIPSPRFIGFAKKEKRRSRRASTGSPLDTVFASTLPLVLVTTGLITLGLGTVAFFPDAHLRWLAIVSILSVWGCTVAALTLIPALLYLTTHWLEIPRPQWHRIMFNHISNYLNSLYNQIRAGLKPVFSSPRRILTGFTGMMILLMIIPVFGITLCTTSEDTMPTQSATAKFYILRQAQYGSTAATPDVRIIGKTTSSEMASWASKISKLSGVSNTIINPENIGNYTVLDVTFNNGVSKRQSELLVSKIRSIPAAFPKMVTGQIANEIDFAQQLLHYVPFSILILSLASFVLMTIVTRQPGISLIASAVTLVVLASSLGITVLIFQDGAGVFLPFLSRFGGVEPNVIVLLVGYGFAAALSNQFYVFNKYVRANAPKTLDKLPLLRKYTPSRGILYTSTAINLAILLAFLPITAQGVKQPALAIALVTIGHAALNRLFLTPLVAKFLNQRQSQPFPLKRETN